MLKRAALAVLGCIVTAGAWSAAGPSGRTINSVLLSYGAQSNLTAVSVPPGATITARVNVTHLGSGQGGRWRATSWSIGGAAATCANHANFDSAGTDEVTFSITAPGTAGTYDAQFIAYQDDACTNGASPTFTLVGGVTVIAPLDNSTVSADPTTVPADGTTASTVTVTLRDGVGNPVAGKTVTLTALSGSSSITPASGVSDASGVVLFYVTDTVIESVTYQATNTTDGVVLSQTATVNFVAPAVVVSFNAVEPGADAVSGKIFTKVAGETFALDIVAIRDGAIDPTFTGEVSVEIVDATSGGACTSLPVVATFSNQTFTKGDKGRHSLSNNTAADAFRNVRVRVSYPVLAPTVVSCSGDNFAIRPATFSVSVTDADRVSAGTARALNSTVFKAGTPVHNAGRPFTITATALNGATKPLATGNYSGSPSALLSPCAAEACPVTVGALDVGTWSASGGTLTSNNANYDDVGSFLLELIDDAFSGIDAADGTPLAQRRIASSAIAVGRFVPERYAFSGTSVALRPALACSPASTFTYMAERIDVRFTLTAEKHPSGTTTRYAGALARLDPTDPAAFNFGAIDTAAPTPLTGRIDSGAPLVTTGSWTSGAAQVVAQLTLRRNAAPDGPFGNARIGIAPVDADLVALDSAALDMDADNNGTNDRAQVGSGFALRLGRLRLQNAHGSELIALPIPVQTQYWNGTTFIVNADDNCTALLAENVALGNYRRNLAAGETAITASGALVNGAGVLRLSAPGAGNSGSVDVSVNLTGSTAGASCTAGMPASTPTGYAYLQGAWCNGAQYNDDPTARATFGVFRNNNRVIFQRENF